MGKYLKNMIKAVALFSGGLDSTLAIKVIMEQGIEVIALNFTSPFCRCDKNTGCGSAISAMSKKLGVKCQRHYLADEYLEIIKNPKYGYGRNLNPCIDCRILKFSLAKKFMEEVGASFLISGEVLGQRPMSQHRRALNIIEAETGLKGLILRPLSAKLFPLTIPENKGWVKRESLLAISGRGRKPQMQLASDYGINDYPCPAGGCLLTDPEFSRRLKDVIKEKVITIKDIELLKTGRYFKVGSSFRLTVGRNEKESNRLLNMGNKNDILFEPVSLPGPTALGRGIFSDEIKDKCYQIIARYTSLEEKVEVRSKFLFDDHQEVAIVGAMGEEELSQLRF